MSFFPKQRIYRSLQVEVDKPKSEIIDILQERLSKAEFHKEEDNVFVISNRNRRNSSGPIHVLFDETTAGKTTVRFDLHTLYPQILKIIVPLLVILFGVIVFNTGWPGPKVGTIALVLCLIAIGILILIVFIREMISRDHTRTFAESLLRELTKY